ncbi:MAG: GTP-binding protein [Planctomycetes bacterium]|nr:GTP-binding protein [Planctomycetota bacterium]
MKRIPVTILTGFLGSGKTTLLNRILSEQHGKRIAVIENEFGEIGIDQALIINADEEIFEMSNGCICCTVRGDLIRVLGNLMKRRDKFDYVVVETTGMADPGPVAQTFFMDDEIRAEFSLDGIITLVDARHIPQQLGRSKESTEQIAFADVLVLNKTDLVTPEELDEIEARVRGMNRMAKIYRAKRAAVPVEVVLGLEAFDLETALVKKPTFLEPEYPFEWTGVYALEAGRYEVSLADGPDPTMSLVAIVDQGCDDIDLRGGAERCVRNWSEPPLELAPGARIPCGRHVRLKLETQGRKSFVLEVERAASVGLFTQHTAAEFDLAVAPVGRAGAGRPLPPKCERTWVAQHEHDDQVGSVGIELVGDIDGEKLNAWIGRLLRERGSDIFRMKGFISIAGDPRRFVFQGVHMLFDGQPDRPWGDSPRRNQLVFIGRNLDRAAMTREFAACRV